MRLIVMFLPLLLFVFGMSVLIFMVYALVTLVRSSQSQAESLKEIERVMKKMVDDRSE